MATNFLGGLSPYGHMAGSMGRHHPHHSQHGGHHMMSPRQSAAHQRANEAARYVAPDMPGAPSRDGAILPAGWPPFAFALANGVNIQNQQMNVQTPFRGQRLVVIVVRNGTSAATTAPMINTLIVGQKPLIASASAIPAEMFTQTSFDTNLVFPPTYPGVIYSLNMFLTSALTTTDTVLVLPAVNGSALL